MTTRHGPRSPKPLRVPCSEQRQQIFYDELCNTESNSKMSESLARSNSSSNAHKRKQESASTISTGSSDVNATNEQDDGPSAKKPRRSGGKSAARKAQPQPTEWPEYFNDVCQMLLFSELTLMDNGRHRPS